MNKCPKCQETVLTPMFSFRWDAKLRQCYFKWHNKILCEGCHSRMEKASRGRFFRNLLGNKKIDDETTYDEYYNVEKMLQIMKIDKRK